MLENEEKNNQNSVFTEFETTLSEVFKKGNISDNYSEDLDINKKIRIIRKLNEDKKKSIKIKKIIDGEIKIDKIEITIPQIIDESKTIVIKGEGNKNGKIFGNLNVTVKMYLPKIKIKNNKKLKEKYVRKNNKYAIDELRRIARDKKKEGRLIFIVGNSGSGKTYLIDKTFKNQNKKIENEIIYTIINAMKQNQYNKLIEKYKKYDIVVFEDTDFMINRVRLQAEFVKLIGILLENKVNVIITSKVGADNYSAEFNNIIKNGKCLYLR